MAAIPEAPRAGRWALMFFSAALLSTGALARGSPSTTAAPPKPAAKSTANKPTKAKVLLLVEQRALDLIKAASARGCAAAAGATTTTYATGVHYAALAPGAMAINKNRTAYYLSGNTWFQPVYGANGVYYTVVAAA